MTKLDKNRNQGEIVKRDLETKLYEAKNLVEVQGMSGNWNYCEYMRGMFNGMELILSIFEEREPLYRDALPIKEVSTATELIYSDEGGGE